MFLQKKKSVTLIECVLAMALGILVLVPLSSGLKISLDSWRNNNERNELIHNVRIAIHRMTSELKYATKLLQVDSATHSFLEFETTHMLDTDPDIEKIYFFRYNGNGVLYRKVDDGAGYPAGYPESCYVAGYPSGPVYVDALTFTPLKLASGDLTPLSIPPDTLDDAVAVQIDLTMRDEENDTVSVSSMAMLRYLKL